MPTLAAYRRAVFAALDDGGVYTVTSGPSATTVIIQALGDGATNPSASRYDGAWIYLATGAGANQQRRIIPGSLVAATGQVTLELAWTSPSLGDTAEITHLFPCSSGVGPQDTTYLDLINAALRRLWAPDRLSLAFAGTSTASIATWPWLDRPERLVRVLEASPVTGYPELPCMWRNPQLNLDGAAPVLQLNQPFTGTLALEVRRPGDTLISGVEASGFSAEAQTALPSVEDVVCGALAEAYRALANRTPGRPNGAWQAKYEAQEQMFRGLFSFDRTQYAPQAPSAAAGAAA